MTFCHEVVPTRCIRPRLLTSLLLKIKPSRLFALGKAVKMDDSFPRRVRARLCRDNTFPALTLYLETLAWIHNGFSVWVTTYNEQ